MKAYNLKIISKIILKFSTYKTAVLLQYQLNRDQGVLDLLLSVTAGLMKFNEGAFILIVTFFIQQTIETTAVHAYVQKLLNCGKFRSTHPNKGLDRL